MRRSSEWKLMPLALVQLRKTINTKSVLKIVLNLPIGRWSSGSVTAARGTGTRNHEVPLLRSASSARRGASHRRIPKNQTGAPQVCEVRCWSRAASHLSRNWSNSWWLETQWDYRRIRMPADSSLYCNCVWFCPKCRFVSRGGFSSKGLEKCSLMGRRGFEVISISRNFLKKTFTYTFMGCGN